MRPAAKRALREQLERVETSIGHLERTVESEELELHRHLEEITELEGERCALEDQLEEGDDESRNLRACAQNVLNAWLNPHKGMEGWDRLRQKMDYLAEALAKEER